VVNRSSISNNLRTSACRLQNFNGMLFGNLNSEAGPLFAESPGLQADMEERIIGMGSMVLQSTVEKEVGLVSNQ
jgi:hypothetical protein